MITSMNGYEISISEDNYFDDETYMYRQIVIKENDKTKMVGVVLDEADNEFDLMRVLFDHLNNFLNLPLVDMLPEPLRTIVKEQEQSTYGMLFYDNEEDFPFTEDELKLLDKQINQYNLGYLIEVNPDANVGDPIVTCYMSLCTYFNFIGSATLNHYITETVDEWLLDKEIQLDLSLMNVEKVITSWSQQEIEESKAEFFGQLIDCVEDFLEEKGISIRSEYRDLAIAAGEDPEGLALIYGEDYGYLADQFAKILNVTR